MNIALPNLNIYLNLPVSWADVRQVKDGECRSVCLAAKAHVRIQGMQFLQIRIRETCIYLD